MKTTWDLSHLYSSEEKWLKDFEKLKNKIDYTNNIVFEVNVKNILLVLKNISELNIIIEGLYCYQKRKVDLNLDNEDAKMKVNQALELYSKILVIINNYENFINQHSKEFINLLSNEELSEYKRYINLILRKNENITNEETFDKTLNKIRTYYRNLLEQLKFENINNDGKEIELTKKSYSNLMKNKNENIRKQAFNNYSAGYAKLENDILDCFIKKYKSQINLSNKEKYASLLDKKLFELELPSMIIKELINKTHEHLFLTSDYINFKKELLGQNKLNIYDNSLSICNIPDFKISFEEAYKLIIESLKILGEDYVSDIEEIFNDGWIDLYPKEKKNSMSFTSISYLGSYILTNFKKDLISTRTVAHEIGHRINTKYSSKNNNILNFEFSMFLTEIASKVNEMLFNHYIIEKYNDLEIKKYILNDVISSLFNSLFGQMMLTEFEYNIINKIENNELIDENIINNIYLEIYNKYNIGIEENDYIKYGWLKIQHFIMQDSYYLFQYTIGTALALNISNRILNNEIGFVDKYKKFLSLGNSVSVIDALKTIDINLGQGDYMEYAYDTLDTYIKTLKKICKK